MAGVHVEISSLEEARLHVQARQAQAGVVAGPNQQPISFELRRTAPLREAALIKARVRPGNSAHEVVNAELLDTKFFAYLQVEEGINRIIREGTADAIAQIADASECLNRLQRYQQVPEANMPHRGPPLVDRGKGLLHCIYLDNPAPNPFRGYDADVHYPPEIHDVDAPADMQVEEGVADRMSQRGLFKMNIKAEYTRKVMFTEFKTNYEAAMRKLMRKHMEEETDIGAGYADFRMLSRADQPDYNMNYPRQ